MVEIIPALMPRDYDELEILVGKVNQFAKHVQIDVMDGVYVKNKSFPYGDIKGDFGTILREEKALPFWDEIDYEVDLMVVNPQRDALDWIKAGVSRIIIHKNSSEDACKIIKELKAQYGGEADDPFRVEFGVAIMPEEDISTIGEFIEEADFVQQMGIENIGHQGEEMSEGVLSNISTLRSMYPQLIISVDGGVNLETAERLISLGVDRLVSGSYILNSENPKNSFDSLSSL